MFDALELAYADAIRRFAYANPCDADAQKRLRRELEETSPGAETEQEAERQPAVEGLADATLQLTTRRAEGLAAVIQARRRQAGGAIRPEDFRRLEDLVIASLYLRFFVALDAVGVLQHRERVEDLYVRFSDRLRAWSRAGKLSSSDFLADDARVFAVFFQHRLAVTLLHGLIRGESRPIGRLRAAIWHSIFPKELRLYGVLLYERMHDVTTLILGPSGTGKELVANAIGLARYIPFDKKTRRFVEPLLGAYHPINLSAMPRELIESEMFGHVAGSFTGAVQDRVGWFEKCRRGHAVFLDELGELDPSVQVRLLRVLQNREFYRVGETEPHKFEGRVLAATNRDLSALIEAGAFREDLYFRLCSDVVTTPSLREQLDDSPDELPSLTRYVAERCLGKKAAAEYVENLSSATLRWIERSPEMGQDYAWPGNFRELEQCVRSVMVRGEYHPPARSRAASAAGASASKSRSHEPTEAERFASDMQYGRLSMDEALVRYCSLVFARSGSVAEAARRLKKHRLTVQSRIDPQWADRFRQEESK